MLGQLACAHALARHRVTQPWLNLLPPQARVAARVQKADHALLDKGLVKARNFRRSGNKHAYAYVLTPTGLRTKLSLTRAFLARKEAEFEQLQHTIAALKDELSEAAE